MRGRRVQLRHSPRSAQPAEPVRSWHSVFRRRRHGPRYPHDVGGDSFETMPTACWSRAQSIEIEIARTASPKQTETTQRGKLTLRLVENGAEGVAADAGRQSEEVTASADDRAEESQAQAAVIESAQARVKNAPKSRSDPTCRSEARCFDCRRRRPTLLSSQSSRGNDNEPVSTLRARCSAWRGLGDLRPGPGESFAGAIRPNVT